MIVFVFEYKLRKGLGPEWVDKIDEVAIDDIPPELADWEIKNMAINEFKFRRLNNGSSTREYIIKNIITNP